MIAAIVVVLVLLGVAAAFAVYGARRRPVAATVPQTQGWTGDAGDEFAGLSESGRCDLVFALAALDDDDSLALLEKALDDPSEPVALAAAHALASRDAAGLQRYFAAHPGPRADRIAQTLALLEGGPSPSS